MIKSLKMSAAVKVFGIKKLYSELFFDNCICRFCTGRQKNG